MFRANEEAAERRSQAFNYFIPKGAPVQAIRAALDGDKSNDEEILRARHALSVITDKLGPFVAHYPEWHPLMSLHNPGHHDSRTQPNVKNLDHTRYLVNGFITCPYHGGDELIASIKERMRKIRGFIENQPVAPEYGGWFNLVSSMTSIHAAYITDELIERLEDEDGYSYFEPQPKDFASIENLIPLYAPNAQPILVWVEWDSHLKTDDNKIPAAAAVPLMLARELIDLPHAQCSETWESMRYLLLGGPHGARSSMFLDQLTVKQMRTMFNALMSTGAYDK